MVKGYAGYERALLTHLAELRGKAPAPIPPASAPSGEERVERRDRLVALAEAYPDLKASENFRDLQTKLVDTENQIQYARRYYNGCREPLQQPHPEISRTC
jgi:LemA protein